ncbi:small ribosomal subunit protein bTHXc-like [Curcuma longa]|uniref:small ribosomal subunit protein bTHXc-like n=1 Tax=Curcuma longa TaxID=136217 RepID=UPI003D9E5E0F
MALLCFGMAMGAAPMAVATPRLSFSRTESLSNFSSALSVSPHRDSTALPAPLHIYCGRGDKKTARGKRFKHSFGNARPRNKSKGRGPPRTPVPPSPPKKDKFDDGEVVRIEIDESLFS